MEEGPCPRQQEIMEELQEHLMRLAALAREEAEAVRTGSENLWMAIDKQIESELGEKERALGALKEHRREHGC